MSDEPITRPGEISRINDLAKGDGYRVEVLTTLAILKDRSDQSVNWQHNADTWRNDHDIKNATDFTDIRADIRALKKNMGNVTSGVDNYKENKAELVGARKMVLGFIFIVAAIYGAWHGLVSLFAQVKP